jgi:hypothetical protein
MAASGQDLGKTYTWRSTGTHRDMLNDTRLAVLRDVPVQCLSIGWRRC